jgi:L-fuconolactonase
VIVDAHHHLWDPASREYPWLAGDALAPIRKRYDADELRDRALAVAVARTVLVQTVSEVEETVEFLATADDNRDLIAGVVGWIDLTAPNVAEELARLRQVRGGDLLVGIRHQAQDEPDPNWLARDEVVAGVRTVADAGLVYDLLVVPEQLPAAINLAVRVPDGRFVLDHAAKPRIAADIREPWTSQVRQLADLPNVACKLSGLVTEADWRHWSAAGIQPYADTVLAAFGADRVMFGSDWPVCELVTGYTEVFELAKQLCTGLSHEDRTLVFGDTARNWYRLPED